METRMNDTAPKDKVSSYDHTRTILIHPKSKSEKGSDREPVLVVLEGTRSGEKFQVTKEKCIIGANSDNDIVLNDPAVSRQHCEIRPNSAGFMLRDLKSTNGTFIGKARITEAHLEPGTQFKVGNTLLAFCDAKDLKSSINSHKSPENAQVEPELKVRKFSSHGTGYSIVEWNHVRHVYVAAVPRSGTTLREQADDALRIIAAVNDVHGAAGSIVHQAVYVANPDHMEECRAIIRNFYEDAMPCTSYILQAPCNGKLLAIEAIGLAEGDATVEIERINEALVVVRDGAMTWVHAAPPETGQSGASAYDQAQATLRQLDNTLEEANVSLDQVLRTWFYQGGIIEDEGASQRYKELNRARDDHFKGVSFLTSLLPDRHAGGIYPASTGIGANGRGLNVSAIALAKDAASDVVAVPLENPRQTAAYDYTDRYSPKSPKFSRAMAVASDRYAMLFISGTASITHAETRHIGDVEAQTEETLDNIAALIAEDNLEQHGLPGFGTTLKGLGLARVYVKNQDDYDRVRAVCERRFGELPTIYAVADVCRPDLLVEIEGIALSKRH